MRSEEMEDHLRESGREALRAVKAACDEGAGHLGDRLTELLPRGSREHLENARREFLLAVKVAVDSALEGKTKAKKKPKARARRVKVE